MGAEFIGTFMLIFAATAMPIINQKSEGAETLLGLAASTGLAGMVVILTTGHFSGAHLNPAVTIAFTALNRFPWRHVGLYITAQVAASLFHLKIGGGVTVPSTNNHSRVFALEVIITFNLMFVVSAMATDTRNSKILETYDRMIGGTVSLRLLSFKARKSRTKQSQVGELAAIAVGASVMLNIFITGPMRGASMNPVRTLGPAVASGNYKAIWIYLTAPVLGALLEMATYAAVRLPEEDDSYNEHRRRRP